MGTSIERLFGTSSGHPRNVILLNGVVRKVLKTKILLSIELAKWINACINCAVYGKKNQGSLKIKKSIKQLL